ncbi:hypothetical protein R69888_02376 [Paraburkholderia haematera]|uniref:Transposase n=1 Tax=Paraburkholderia haematera TaxID=2793077 RepID=A0ABN7LDK7_9BURK|nr:hypothetical protein R69888_02376 [Paraburkholderia haematera]
MKEPKSLYHGLRFPAVVISCAVRWSFRFQLSLRDIEERLFERVVTVTYSPKEVPLGDETIRRWCGKFGKGFAHRVKAVRRKPGSTWHLDEMFVRYMIIKAISPDKKTPTRRGWRFAWGIAGIRTGSWCCLYPPLSGPLRR